MALDFVTAGTDVVNHGSDSSLDDLSSFTLAFWAMPDALASNNALWGKLTNTSANNRFVAFDGLGNLRIFILGSANWDYRTNDTPVSTGNWYYIAVTFDAGVSPDVAIYVGSPTSILSESAYSSSADGSAKVADSNNNLHIGNNGNTANCWDGKIATAQIWNRALTLGELQAQQFRPRVTNGCVLYTHYGFNGTGTQPDWSGNGNSGTVTGATVVDHAPVAPPFGFDSPYAAFAVSGAAALTADFSLNAVAAIANGATSAALADFTLPVITGITPVATAQTAASLTLDAIALISDSATSAASAAINLDVITATDMSAQAAAAAALSILQALGIDTSAAAGTSASLSLDAILGLAISAGQDVIVDFSLNAVPGYSNASVAGASGTLSFNVVPVFIDSGMAATLGSLALDAILTIVTSTGQDVAVAFTLNVIPAISQSATAAMVASLALDAVVTIDTVATAASAAGFTIGAVYGIGMSTAIEVVTPDGRIYVILSEGRVYAIESDNRIFEIEQENRVYNVPEE